MKSIALMGLGAMGSGMARRLIGAGYPVVVYNRSRARTEGFPTVASTPREAAASRRRIAGTRGLNQSATSHPIP